MKTFAEDELFAAPAIVPATATPCASSFALGVTSSHAAIGPDEPLPEKVILPISPVSIEMLLSSRAAPSNSSDVETVKPLSISPLAVKEIESVIDQPLP
jgi:hypothetical protein